MTAIVSATSEMVREFYGNDIAKSARMLAAIEDGRVIGILGMFPQGSRNVIFMDLTARLRAQPRVIFRAWTMVLRWIEQSRMPVHTMCDETIEAAERFLVHFGFRRVYQGVFVWTG